MKVWRYEEQMFDEDNQYVYTCSREMTEQEILDVYWKSFYDRRVQQGVPPHLIFKEECIEDWADIHWANLVDEDNIIRGEE